MSSISQGAKANLNGKIFEEICTPIFRNHGFEVLSHVEFNKREKANTLPSKYVIKDAPFITIYGHKGKTEFLIVLEDEHRKIRVENKYQAKAGSVDEKYPYTLLNAIQAYPEKEIIIIIDGGGYKAGARQWVVDRVKENWMDFAPDKDIKVMSIIEFTNWFNDNF